MKYHVYLDNEVFQTNDLERADEFWESYAKQKQRAMLVNIHGRVLKNTSTSQDINQSRLIEEQIQVLMEQIGYGPVSQPAEEQVLKT